MELVIIVFCFKEVSISQEEIPPSFSSVVCKVCGSYARIFPCGDTLCYLACWYSVCDPCGSWSGCPWLNVLWKPLYIYQRKWEMRN